MHKTLIRQIKKIYGQTGELPEKFKQFVELIDRTYAGYDEDRKLVERSLDLSSKEMAETNKQLLVDKENIEELVKVKTQELQEKVKTLEKLNDAMVDREIVMINLKGEVDTLSRELGQEPKYNKIQ